ncbi:unnamed protein product [Darwinula stevensoni]|uniref:Harmonin-binding protein USHBP1 PDZ-binding domain-containing protein n=1 Tax=Darwinula stevensoni TaxID=69355 RepID=A0A7R8X6J7_9CRUS|nr:unnamed protein product [Darwinula stevensoni]CAG0888175.1 unnamed protein product [Darwinula stevensoni]
MSLLHLAAVTGQRAELLELSSRLQVLSRDKENLTKALAKAQVSLVKVLARDEDRLALYGADTFLIQNEKVEMAHRYEARLTELHSVIAELGRKQEAHQASMIQEEELEEVEEVEEVEELEDQLEDHLENRLEEQLEEQEAEEEEPNCKESEDCAEKDEFRIPQPLEAAAASSPAAHLNEGTLGSSEREEGEAERLRSSLDILRRENAFLRKKVRDILSPHVRVSIIVILRTFLLLCGKLFELEPAGEEERTGGVELVTRVAERIRLRRVEQGDKHLSGSDISAFGGVSSTRMAEHLAEDIRKDSSTQELFNALAGCALPEMQVKEFEVELERLNAKMEHLRAENDVLSLTLEETKSQCNHLSVLLGRYESNCTALRLALTCTEQVVEAYEALLGLLESELGMLMANCRLAGVLGSRSSDEDAQETLKKAVHGKAHKENAAQRVLVSLATADRLYPSPSRTSIGSTGSGSSGGRSDGMGGGGEDKQLRAHISRLRREKKRILSTVVDDLECPPLHTTDSSELPPTHFEAHKIDLENAILLQELAGLKEEKAELKAQLYLMEKEKSSLDLRLEGKETHENVLRTQIQLLHAELRETKDPSARQTHDGVEDQVCRMSEAEKHRKLIESMRKERRLRTKVSELTNLLEKLNRNCELRLQQSSEFTADLKRANAALMQAIERCKRRTEGKNKRLERQMLTLVETHAAQIRSMKGKISYLEERLAHRASHPSLASETEL